MADINVASNQYVVLNDWIFSPSNQAEAPAWLLNLIDNVVKSLIASNFTDYDLLVQEVRNAIDSLNVAQNTFDQYWNLEQLIDGIVLSYIQTLNANIAGVQSQIVTLQNAIATNEFALTQAIQDLTADYQGYANARATEVTTAFADADGALASSIQALTVVFEDQQTDLSGTADAVSGLQTYVGLTGDNNPNGTGILSRISILEKQTDGIIEYTIDTYDVMIGIEDPNNDTGNDQLDLTKEPYASWRSADTALDYVNQDGVTVYSQEVRASHVGDVFIQYEDDENGTRTYVRSYKFIKTAVDSTSPYATDSEGYTWALVTDTDAQSAYVIALNAQDLADGKRRVFVDTPFAPYDEGDLWIDNSGASLDPPEPQIIKVCVTTRSVALPTDPTLLAAALASEWKLADEQAQYFITNTYEPDSAQIHRQLDGVIEYYFLDSYNVDNDNFSTLDFTDNADEAETLVEIAGLYTTQILKDNANGNIIYFKDSRKAYWYQASSSSWVTVTDTSIYQALQDAAKAQGTADSKVSQFYAWYTSNDTPPYDIGDAGVVAANFKYWYKTDGILYKLDGAVWKSLTEYPDIDEGDILTVYEPTQGDLTTYTYNGTSWQQSGPTGIIAKSKFFVDLEAAVNGAGGLAEAQADLVIAVETYAKNGEGYELSGLSALDVGWTTDPAVKYAESDAAPINACQTLNYEDAVSFARAKGLRLPTLDEVKNGLGQGTGCSYDSALIWTSTRGVAPDTHYRVKGLYTGADGEIEETSDITLAPCRFVADSENTLNEATLYAQSKFEYNAPVTINGITQNAGFGLVNSSSLIPGLTVPTGNSEFWVDANRFVLKNPDVDGVQAVFTVTESGVKLGIEHTEATRNVPQGSYSSSSTYFLGDIVSSGPSSYVAINKVVDANGVEIGFSNIPVTNTSYWQLLVSADVYKYVYKDQVTKPSAVPTNDAATGWLTEIPNPVLNTLWQSVGLKAAGTGSFVWSPVTQVTAKDGLSALLYEWSGTTSWPVNTTISSASTWTFSSPFAGNAFIRINATDAEGGVRVGLNGTELGTMTGADNAVQWYEFSASNLVTGTNTISIWAASGDAGNINNIQVAFVGGQGITGAYTDFLFTRKTTTPADPGGADTWYTNVTSVPAGEGKLWSIKKNVTAGGAGTTYTDKRVIEADIIREVVLYSDLINTADDSPNLPTDEFTYNFSTDSLVGTHASWNTTFPSGLADGKKVYRTTAVFTGNITQTGAAPTVNWTAATLYAERKDGISFTGTTEYYRLSATELTNADRYSSGTTIATSWTTSPQTPTSVNKYLYNFNRSSKSDETFGDSSVTLLTQYVKDGRGISSISEKYQVGSSGTTAPTGTWSSTIPEVTDSKPYLWNQTTIAYDDSSTSTVILTLIAIKGGVGTPADTFKEIFLYQNATSVPTEIPTSSEGFTASTGLSAATGDWTTSINALNTGEKTYRINITLQQPASTGNWSAVDSAWTGPAQITGLDGNSADSYKEIFLYANASSQPTKPALANSFTVAGAAAAVTGWTVAPTDPPAGKFTYRASLTLVQTKTTGDWTNSDAAWNEAVKITGEKGESITGTRGIASLTHTISLNEANPAALTSTDIATYWNAAASTEFQDEIAGDTVIITNTYTGKGWTYIYQFNGTEWSPSVAWQVDGNAVVTGTLSAGAIGTGTLDASNVTISGTTSTFDIKSSATGARMEIRSDVIKIYDGTLSTPRVILGNLSG